MIAGKTEQGLQFAVRRGGSSVGYCALSIRCGTRDEEGYHGGIAHFTEHTLFKGTARKSAAVVNGYLDRLGGELNAFTTKEEIVLHATVLKEDLPKAAGLLFELATEATFPEKEVETEKGVVIDEIQSYKDSPADEIYDRFEEMLYEGHPLGRSILGKPASVRRITSDELRRFVRENFTPERMAFTMMADFSEARMEQDVRKLAARFFPSAGGSIGAENVLLRRTPPKQAWVPPSYDAEGGTVFRGGQLRNFGITENGIPFEKRGGSAGEIVAGDDFQRIVHAKVRHEQRLQLVIPVGTLPQDAQSQIDFDIGIRNHRLRTVSSIRAATSSRRPSGTCSSTGDRNEII